MALQNWEFLSQVPIDDGFKGLALRIEKSKRC